MPPGALIGRLRSFLGIDGDAGAEAPRPAGAKPRRAKAVDLDAQIRRILQSEGAAGRLQVISLDKLGGPMDERERASFAEKIKTTVTQVILHRLGPRDSFTQTGDNSFIIIFDKMSKEDAELECVLIVQEVLQALYAGAPSESRVDIRTAAVGLDGRVAVENVNLLDVIDRLLREEQEKKIRQAENKQAKAAATPAHKPPAPIPAAAVVPGVTAPRSDDAERYEDIMKVVPDRPVVFEYRPLWDVKRKVLSAYSCILVSGGPGINEAHTDEAETYRRAAVDFLTIGRVTHEMRRLYSVSRRLLMHCPVHIDTLCDPGTWATYKILCERISHTPMKRELIFEIIGIDPDADRTRIRLAAARLKPHCRHIVACTDPRETDLNKFGGAPFAYLSMSADSGSVSEKRLMKHLDGYAEAAQNLRFGAIATGLSSLSMVIAAVGSGFDMIGGSAIHPAVVRPEFVYRFEARNLLGKLLA